MFQFLKDFDRAMRFAQSIDADRFCFDKKYRKQVETALREGYGEERKAAPTK